MLVHYWKILIAKFEHGGFDPENLGNIKKDYVSIIDNKQRLLDMYKYTLAIVATVSSLTG